MSRSGREYDNTMEHIAERDPGKAQLVGALGAITALLLAGLLVLVRGEIGPTNVALLLGIVVAGAAVSGGRTAGVITGVVAAVSYNFFHTLPYRSLRIDDAKDILTVVILVVGGVALGELSRQWDQTRVEADRSRGGIDRVVRVAEMAADDVPSAQVETQVEHELVELLSLDGARFELGAHAGESRAVLDHRGVVGERNRVFVGGEFTLPPDGADLAVTYGGRELGRLVLMPGEQPVGVSLAQRRCAVALADQLACSLARATT